MYDSERELHKNLPYDKKITVDKHSMTPIRKLRYVHEVTKSVVELAEGIGISVVEDMNTILNSSLLRN